MAQNKKEKKQKWSSTKVRNRTGRQRKRRARNEHLIKFYCSLLLSSVASSFFTKKKINVCLQLPTFETLSMDVKIKLCTAVHRCERPSDCQAWVPKCGFTAKNGEGDAFFFWPEVMHAFYLFCFFTFSSSSHSSSVLSVFRSSCTLETLPKSESRWPPLKSTWADISPLPSMVVSRKDEEKKEEEKTPHRGHPSAPQKSKR